MTIVNFDLAKQASLALTRTANVRCVAPGKVGVLLSNLGTPDGTDYWSSKRLGCFGFSS